MYKNILNIPKDNSQMTKLYQQSSTTLTCIYKHIKIKEFDDPLYIWSREWTERVKRTESNNDILS